MSRSKKLTIFAIALVLMLTLPALYTVPLYSTTVGGCAAEKKTHHRSLIFGANKESISKEVDEFLEKGARADCPVNQVTFNLYIL